MWPVVSGDDDVHSGARLADVGRLLVVHFAQRVGEGARGIDDALGTHVKLPACNQQELENERGLHEQPEITRIKLTRGVNISDANRNRIVKKK